MNLLLWFGAKTLLNPLTPRHDSTTRYHMSENVPSTPTESTPVEVDAAKAKAKAAAKDASGSVKAFISGGAGGVAAVLVGESIRPTIRDIAKRS